MDLKQTNANLMEQGYGTSYGIRMGMTAGGKKGVDGSKNHNHPLTWPQTVLKSILPWSVLCAPRKSYPARLPSAIQILKSCWIELSKTHSLPWIFKQQRARNQAKAVPESCWKASDCVATRSESNSKTKLKVFHVMELLTLSMTQRLRPRSSPSVLWTFLTNAQWQVQIINSSPGIQSAFGEKQVMFTLIFLDKTGGSWQQDMHADVLKLKKVYVKTEEMFWM